MTDFNVTVTGGDTILVSVPDSLATVIQSVGAGSSIISNTVDSTVTLKSFVAGSGVTIDDNGTELTITSGGLGAITTDEVTEGLNNLYFTDQRVADAIATSAETASLQITGAFGPITYNSDDGTLDLPLNESVTLQLGQESLINVKNESGVTLNNGQAVYVTGASGSKLTVGLADSGQEFSSATTIALMTQSLSNNGVGYATTQGLVRGLNTIAYAEGSAIYLNSNGGWSTTKPNTPDHLVPLGWIVRSHATEGSVFVHINNGQELEELHNVRIDVETDGDILRWDATLGYWKNEPLPVETDPVFTASAASGIVAGDITNWNTAYGWGDHSTAGYATSGDITTALSNQLITDHADFLDIQGGLDEGQVLVYSVAAGNKWVNTYVNSDIVPEGTTNLYLSTTNLNTFSINDIGDVDTSTVANNNVLVWNGATWTTENPLEYYDLATGASLDNQLITEHADFLDIQGGLAEGQVLVYSVAAGNKWVNTYVNSDIVPEGTVNLYFTDKSIDGLNDVDTSTVAPIVDDVLVFDGTNWVPSGIVGDIDAALTAILGA